MKKLKINWTIDDAYDFLTEFNSPEGIKVREECVKMIREIHEEDMIEFDKETQRITERLINDSGKCNYSDK